jgi:2-polyprenyl-3-methyl-5-hydroxy-6-metoxy-1,4-benzoquinol methylase
MPCYNEAETITEILRRVLASPWVRELIVVDDASGDATVDLIRNCDDPRVQLFVQPINLGKGAALRRGFEQATSPYVIVQDADLEYDPSDYAHVLAPLLNDDADVVYGSRFSSGRAHRVLYFWHAVGNRILTLTSNVFTNLNLSDMETGYKAFRREVIQSIELQEDRFGIEPEITAKVADGRWRVWEVSISYAGRTYAEGKKIGWRDGLRAFYAIGRYSKVWRRLRSRLDKAPDRNKPPAGFDEADTELNDTLHALEHAENYVDWIYALVAPYAGRNVLEIGAGHGDLTERLRTGRTVTATDLSQRCLANLRERFADCPNVEVRKADVTALSLRDKYDSVILVNVLEHIDDDVKALADLRSLLRPGGHVCVFVPAFEGLYSEFDWNVGHRRRYRRSQLASTFDRAGFAVTDLRYINTAGALAWWTFARQLGQVPTRQWSVSAYDRAVVPLLRRLEHGRSPRFGQSLLCVGELAD